MQERQQQHPPEDKQRAMAMAMTLRSGRTVYAHAPAAKFAEMLENWPLNISEQDYLNWVEQVKSKCLLQKRLKLIPQHHRYAFGKLLARSPDVAKHCMRFMATKDTR